MMGAFEDLFKQPEFTTLGSKIRQTAGITLRPPTPEPPESAIGPMMTPTTVGLEPNTEWHELPTSGGVALARFNLNDPHGGRLSNLYWVEESGVYPKKSVGALTVALAVVVYINFAIPAPPSEAVIFSGSLVYRNRAGDERHIIGQSILISDVSVGWSADGRASGSLFINSTSTIPSPRYRGVGSDYGVGLAIGASGLPDGASDLIVSTSAQEGWPGTTGMVVSALDRS